MYSKLPNSLVCVSQQPGKIIIIFKDTALKVKLLGTKEYVCKILIDAANSHLKKILTFVLLYVISENVLFHTILPTQDFMCLLNCRPPIKHQCFNICIYISPITWVSGHTNPAPALRAQAASVPSEDPGEEQVPASMCSGTHSKVP